jgi:hypothetical protein
VCENVGLECNQDSFYNLLASMAEHSLNELVENIKNVPEVKNKKDSSLSTVDVRKVLEEQNIFIATPKIIPELGINKGEDIVLNFEQDS